MKKTIFRILALAVAIVLTLSLATTAFAEDAPPATSGICGENLTWTFNPETGELSIEGTGPMTDYDTERAPWFDIRGIKTLTVGEGVTTIGNHAFVHTVSEVTKLPSTLKSIGETAFLNCPLQEIVIPDGVETIGSRAFGACSILEYVTIGKSVTSIGEFAFGDCRGLRSIVLPAGLTMIGDGAFHANHLLTNVYFGGTEAAWNSIQISENNENLLEANIYVEADGYVFPFPDVAEDYWAHDSIAILNAAGVISGYKEANGSFTFRPNKNVTRAEFVTMLAKVIGVPPVMRFDNILHGYGYSDVPKDSTEWYAHYVHWAQISEIVFGYEDGTFRPNDSITREEMAAILCRFLTAYQLSAPPVNEPMVFQDANNISAYAKDAVSALQIAGIINGYPDGTFLPKNSATRAETSIMLCKLYCLLDELDFHYI